nr:MAG TPA: hypothetical protein [Inoviridae sp.]
MPFPALRSLLLSASLSSRLAVFCSGPLSVLALVILSSVHLRRKSDAEFFLLYRHRPFVHDLAAIGGL